MIIKNSKNEKKIILTIDFEDFFYDFSSEIKSSQKKDLESHLMNIYQEIEYILKANFISNGITFFTTGNLLERYPNLVKQISLDNEIALHSYEHNSPENLSYQKFEQDLQRAILIYKKILKKEPKGYRAPNFGVGNDINYFKIISKYFKYDSSYQLNNFSKENNFKDIYEFPIFKNNFFLLRSRIIGGTFLKIFPYSIIKQFVLDCIKNNFYPIIYLHPYELCTDFNFYVNCFKKNNLNIYEKFYWSFRQLQWIGYSNFFIKKKLNLLLKEFEIIGRMENFLE